LLSLHKTERKKGVKSWQEVISPIFSFMLAKVSQDALDNPMAQKRFPQINICQVQGDFLNV
jgi:hypothetical protein